jgi:hypothetical protein
MVSTRWIRCAVVLLASACSLVSTGCVPIPNTMSLSPTTIGTVQQEDGIPVAGKPLLLSVEYNDSTCTRPALHTVTDSEGHFEFPAVRKRERFTAVLFERTLYYSICAAPADQGSLYEARFLHRVPPVDSLSCITISEAVPGGGQRIQCGPRPRPSRG